MAWSAHHECPAAAGAKNVSQMQVLVHSLHSVDHPASSEDAARAPRSLLSVRRVLLKLLRQRATTWRARAEHMETHRLLKRRKSDLTHDRRHRVGLTKQRNSSVHLVRASVPSLDSRTARPVDFAGTHHAVVRHSADGDPRGGWWCAGSHRWRLGGGPITALSMGGQPFCGAALERGSLRSKRATLAAASAAEPRRHHCRLGRSELSPDREKPFEKVPTRELTVLENYCIAVLQIGSFDVIP